MPFQTTVSRQSNDTALRRAAPWVRVSLRSQCVWTHPGGPEKRRSRHTQKTTIVTGQGDRNRPLVMKCDCPDGCLSPCGANCCLPNILQPCSCNPVPEGLLSISTERQTGSLGGSGAAPCAVTADCCGYGTPAEMITADQALAKAHRARPVVRGRASAG